ncbi:YbjN domain-containing protein [uncultured Corynebacterium sp.]|uniref:YbjN domain-containing protein n=1 Tax=uncultured Corynebacterium sp. TaxID=159447 RepID=UPI0025F4E12A|nr:YbjN domain-containing protein [uncultured Corynebacterium sp.]
MTLDELTDLLDAALGGPDGAPDKGGAGYSVSDGVAVVELPGEARLKTNTLFIPQSNGLRVEAFVCRAVEENHADVYRMLLQHNRKSFGVHYTLDNNSDIYLVGQFTDALDAEDVQRILGQVLELADGDFNRILERGFEGSIRREWAWRLDRGESTRNLEAFRKLRPDADEGPDSASAVGDTSGAPAAPVPGVSAPLPPNS